MTASRTTTSWAEALDQFEANLVKAKQELAGGTESHQLPWPPKDLQDGPVPQELRKRGQRLFEESEMVQKQIRELQIVRQESASTRRRARHYRSKSTGHRISTDL